MRTRCEKCPLKDRPCVEGFGGEPGCVMVISGAPMSSKQLWYGRDWDLVKDTLAGLGIDPKIVCFTSAVQCYHGIGKRPSIKEIKACRSDLLAEIQAVMPSKILILGAAALNAMHGKVAKFHEERGLGQMFEGIYCVATHGTGAIMKDPDVYREFVEDIYKLKTHDAPLPRPHVDVMVADESNVHDLLYEIKYASVLACDIETTGFNARKDQIESIGFGAVYSDDPNNGAAVIIPWSLTKHGRIRNAITGILTGETYRGLLVYHNGKFDAAFLANKLQIPGLYTKINANNIIDTMLMSYAHDERANGDKTANGASRLRYAGHGLKMLARIFYDVAYTFNFDEFYKLPYGDRDYLMLYDYQGLDCYLTARLYFDLKEELDQESEKLYPLVKDHMTPVSMVLRDMEQRGILIDRPYLENLRAEYADKIKQAKEHLQFIWQWEVVKDNKEEFNPSSGQDIIDLIAAHIGIRLEDTQHDTLVKLRDSLPLQYVTEKETIDHILQYKLYTKLQSTYVESILEKLEDDTLHGTYLQHGTASGRFSSIEPNLQNIPNNTAQGDEIRRAFVARPGYILIEADYSQVELRVLAHLSNDASMKQAFIDGLDIHHMVATKVFERQDISKAERRFAKSIGFGVVYGMGAVGLASGAAMAELAQQKGHAWGIDEAQEFIDQFLGQFPGVKQYIEDTKKEVHAQHYVETLTGRRRRFPFVLDRGRVERQAVNNKIQSLAGDIIQDAMIRLQRALPRDAHMLIQVHDSLLFEVRKELAYTHETIDVIQDVMEKITLFEASIPFPVDIKIGSNWAEMKGV